MKKRTELDDLLIPDYEVKQNENGDLWVSFLEFTINLIKTDEGVVVDVWASDDAGHAVGDEPIATTYAFTNEIDREELD